MIKNSVKGPVGYVNLTKAPSDMKLFVDNKEVKTDATGVLEIAPGKHTLKGTRTDFVEREISITVKEDDTIDTELFLDPLNAVGNQYLLDHPDEAALYSAKSSQEFDKTVKIMLENSPIVQELPIIDPNWRMDYGESVKHTDIDGAIAIYIYATSPEARQNALGWMRLQGYDPSDYEIIFEQP